MCGILGFSGAYDLQSLEKGLRLIDHRGPDDCGIFSDENAEIGLAHSRLSIIDLSSLGHQPMLSSDRQVALVFNGEIYNYQELRNELQENGCIFRGTSDTEVVLNMYLVEGVDMLKRLNGIFAISLWDARSRTMMVARDALGVKPLYYFESNAKFVFASEIKALQPFMHTSDIELNIPALNRYLSFLSCPGADTPFRLVKKLMPGNAMIIKDGVIKKIWEWYCLPIFRPIKFIEDEQEALKGTLFYLKQAIERQMIADVPVGAFLSGGLDSSAVVTFASSINPNIHCFTIDVAGGESEGMVNDLPYARRVAKHLGVPLDVVSVKPEKMADRLWNMVIQMDEPLADPAALNALYISELARESGIKVLLSGAGGDDLFTGYRRHQAIQAERYWDWLPLFFKSALSRSVGQLDQSNTFFRRLNKALSGAELSGDARLVNYFQWNREDALSALYTEDFKRKLIGHVAEGPMIDFLASVPKSVSRLEKMLALEQRFFLADHNLLYTDKMAMAAGVEVRVPFLDLDLVDFASRIPVHMKQRGSTGKWILKKIMEPYLPLGVIYRPKTGFGVPLRHWMRFELRGLLGDLLSISSLKRRGLFNPDAVNQLITQNDLGQIDASYTLLSLLCIEIWCRHYIDGR